MSQQKTNIEDISQYYINQIPDDIEYYLIISMFNVLIVQIHHERALLCFSHYSPLCSYCIFYFNAGYVLKYIQYMYIFHFIS